MTTPEAVEAWMWEGADPLDHAPAYTATNRAILVRRGDHRMIDQALEAASDPLGSKKFTLHVEGSMGDRPFTIEYVVSDVRIVQHCYREHEWGSWRSDFMGGVNRECVRCGKTEFV